MITHRLIVNADDLGADEPRNRGILEVVERGVVTSVSLVANAPALDDAVARLVRTGRRPSCGLHINLSEGRPVSAGLSLLVGPDGAFLGKRAAHRLLDQPSERLAEEVALEIEAQFAVLRERGLAIDHIDGHQHVHVFPAVTRAAIATAGRHGIRWFRVPCELAGSPGDPGAAERGGDPAPADLVREANTFSARARAARPAVASAGLRTTDGFAGLLFKDRVTTERLAVLCGTLPVGLTELMVHPGHVNADITGPFGAFSTIHRERELDALLEWGARVGRGTLSHLSLVPFPGE